MVASESMGTHFISATENTITLKKSFPKSILETAPQGHGGAEGAACTRYVSMMASESEI
jgi:hypothetical protein